MSEKRCYTVKEVQEILDVSRPTVYALLKKKEFRWIQLDGGKYRISKRVLMTGLIISRSKGNLGCWLGRKVTIDILIFYLKMMYDAEKKGESIR